jgi:hypothetical protein
MLEVLEEFSGLGKGGAAVQLLNATPEVQKAAADAQYAKYEALKKGDVQAAYLAQQAYDQSVAVAKSQYAPQYAPKPNASDYTAWIVGGAVALVLILALRR